MNARKDKTPTSEIVRSLQNMDCSQCEYKSLCGCGSKCIIAQKAIARLESIAKEKESCFRLGQMDMQASVVSMLETAAAKTNGVVRGTLLSAAALIKDMVVSGHD